MAGEDLKPGDHVAVRGGSAWPSDPQYGVGIVDPFLTEKVRKGDRFWLVMYPRTITSLRHVWSHPAFPDDQAAQVPSVSGDKAKSERWLRIWCGQNDAPAYETLLHYIGEDDGDPYGLFVGDHESSAEIPGELWDHVEVVLGRKVKHRPTFFRCSC